jgi:hypothetical protein
MTWPRFFMEESMRRFLLFVGLLVSGCTKGPPSGPNLGDPYPVGGEIKLANGVQLRGGIIYFTPVELKDGWKIRFEGAGLIDRNGKYKIGFGGSTAGVPRGEYKVTILPRDYQELPNSNSGSIPSQYREQASTPLTVKVEEKENTFDFVLK